MGKHTLEILAKQGEKLVAEGGLSLVSGQISNNEKKRERLRTAKSTMDTALTDFETAKSTMSGIHLPTSWKGDLKENAKSLKSDTTESIKSTHTDMKTAIEAVENKLKSLDSEGEGFEDVKQGLESTIRSLNNDISRLKREDD